MWQLTPAAIAQAKEEIGRRHAETLIRHAQEIAEWEAAQAEVAALDRLLGAFAARFATSPTSPAAGAAATTEAAAALEVEPSPAQTPAIPAPPLADNRGRDKPAARARNAQQPKNPATNFDTFSRALSRSI
ncbi:MAG TPA: hypothetical protein VKQ73_09845 [Stellaceae bacterium]|nr:hypothetical protein [Stellaceae bacterium]